MELKENNKSVKIQLPNGSVVDVLSSVLDEIYLWVQKTSGIPEGGGYIMGYEHENTGNVSLDDVTHPYIGDIRTRMSFSMRDPRHGECLEIAKARKSYYMGVWHTHPQMDPVPSAVDLEDWGCTMTSDRTGGRYIFFIISGIKRWRIWIGDFRSGEIVEGKECLKNEEGFYMKG